MDKSNLVKQCIEFRNNFTAREWAELNQLIEMQLKEKATKLTLDDLDIQIIASQLNKEKFIR